MKQKGGKKGRKAIRPPSRDTISKILATGQYDTDRWRMETNGVGIVVKLF